MQFVKNNPKRRVLVDDELKIVQSINQISIFLFEEATIIRLFWVIFNELILARKMLPVLGE